ncbi:hypothetical protein KM043_007565 [Ampulex compressa]|nr:hypothetical protein KM043_007565 [Ampulex compressa]
MMKNPRAGLIIVKCQATEPVGQYIEQATAMGQQARQKFLPFDLPLPTSSVFSVRTLWNPSWLRPCGLEIKASSTQACIRVRAMVAWPARKSTVIVEIVNLARVQRTILGGTGKKVYKKYVIPRGKEFLDRRYLRGDY